MRFRLKNLRLDERGLSTVLGFLEAEVMDAAWQHASVSVSDMRTLLKDRKAYSFNTLMTVMNRLVEKGLLRKKRADGTFAYQASVTREEFSQNVSKSIAEALVAGGSLFQASAFVSALKEHSSDDIRLLREILAKED